MSSVLTNFENKSTTKSVILLTMTEKVHQEFLDWFNAELKKRNMGITSAARFIGISHPTIINTVTHHDRPSCETCFKIADAFRVNREYVLRLAGWLLPITDSEEIIRQTMTDMGMISDESKRIISRVVRFIREEAEEYRT